MPWHLLQPKSLTQRFFWVYYILLCFRFSIFKLAHLNFLGLDPLVPQPECLKMGISRASWHHWLGLCGLFLTTQSSNDLLWQFPCKGLKWNEPTWYLKLRLHCGDSHGRLTSTDPRGHGSALMQCDQFLPVLPCCPWARWDLLLLQSQGEASCTQSWGPTSASPTTVSLSLASDRHII